MRVYTTSQVAQVLKLSEPTIRKRTDLPVVQVLADGQRLFDANGIDRMKLAKAMQLPDVFTREQLVDKFVATVETLVKSNDAAKVNDLLAVTPLVLDGATDHERRRLATVIVKMIAPRSIFA